MTHGGLGFGVWGLGFGVWGLGTGVKVAVVDATGKLLDVATVYPHEPSQSLRGSCGYTVATSSSLPVASTDRKSVV